MFNCHEKCTQLKVVLNSSAQYKTAILLYKTTSVLYTYTVDKDTVSYMYPQAIRWGVYNYNQGFPYRAVEWCSTTLLQSESL